VWVVSSIRAKPTNPEQERERWKPEMKENSELKGWIIK
jgi:hypothetical protein